MSRRLLAPPICLLLLACGFASAQSPDFPGLGPPGNLAGLQLDGPGEIVLRGPNARAQIVVAGKFTSGQLHDYTHNVTYEAAPAGIVQVAADGFVVPVADGEAVVTLRSPEGMSTTVPVRVEEFGEPIPINFPNEVVPIFTKLGCNAGGCHGKSGGQNGFRLSLLGFYPPEDYEWLVKDNRGRRIFPAAPEFSLLLTKPLNQVPHGGGRRLDESSYEWEILTRWIEQGMPYGGEDDPVLERIEVHPSARAMNRDAQQQLSVIAHYSDGGAHDVTRLASYESNDTEMAEASAAGRVTIFDRPGEAAVMVRFQGAVSVFRASVPLGLSVTGLPPQKNFVDQHVFGKLVKLGIPPSPLADDSTFVRRVHLDITGRLPTAEEARSFVESTDPQKRDKLIDALLESPGYGEYFANKWANVLRNQRVPQDVRVSFRFHDWIRRALQQNMPYDQFVRSVLAAEGDVETNPTVAWYTQVNTADAQVEDTAQLFLGLRIKCAQCHHHPFERWDQDDYYAFQAFFSQVGYQQGRRGVPSGAVFHRGGVAAAQNPRTQKSLPPAGLGGEPMEIAQYEDPRHKLVDWMTAPDNPFFAKALVNRYWKHFFGRGIIDPEDDMRATNPPSNPELLDALEANFVQSGYNLKELVRTICRSSAYQLSSAPTEYNAADKQNFSSFYLRRLNAEPLYDAINQVAGARMNFGGMPLGTRAVQLPDNGFNDYFLTVFGKPQAQSACECERSAEANLAQTLHLLNSTDIQGKLSAGGGRADRFAADALASEKDKMTELFYAAFARAPREEELALVLDHIDRSPNKKQAYEDILWALFNTKEFLFVR
jgi:hypothetical protein